MAAGVERLQQLLQPTISGLGYELLGVEYLPQGRHSLLRIYIDHPDGITVDDCSRVSHQVSALFDVEDPISGQYTLEVSSPGLDRPLFNPDHYRRFTGSVVTLRLLLPYEGRRRFTGRLHGIGDDDEVVLEVDGELFGFALTAIEKANLVPQW